MTYFAVITEIDDSLEGNYACDTLYVNPNGKEHVAGSNLIVSPPKFDEDLFGKSLMNDIRGGLKTIDLSVEQLITCQSPVFRLGEIMVMDSNDRTIPDGRKPMKWDVKHECFDDIEKATARSREVSR